MYLRTATLVGIALLGLAACDTGTLTPDAKANAPLPAGLLQKISDIGSTAQSPTMRCV